MNGESNEISNAQEVIIDLHRNLSRTSRYQREVYVSFRKSNSNVSRRDFATHMIHWYPAKMFHRIPSVLLDSIDLPPRSTILDPFCGSGTVLLEANLRGHHAIGIDINPLARLIARVKSTILEPGKLKCFLARLMLAAKRNSSTPTPQPTLDYWLTPLARAGLHRILSAIKENTVGDYRLFFLITLTSIVRRVSLADPAIPPLVRLREERGSFAGKRYRKALKKSQSLTVSTVFEAFLDAANVNIRRMSELYALRQHITDRKNWVFDGEAVRTGLRDKSIDAIITSPPYCGSQKYVRSLKLELVLSGYPAEKLRALDRDTLGTEAVSHHILELSDLLTGDQYIDSLLKKIYQANPVRARMASDYCKYLVEFASECQRVLRPGGHLLVTLGRSTMAGVSFPVDRVFRQFSQEAGLSYIATLVDRIPSRGLLTRRNKTAGRIDHEFIVWLRSPQ